MKRIVKLLTVVVAMAVTFGCAEPEFCPNLDLDVTPNNIKGTWRMESYDNGAKLEEGSYYYIVFDRAERTFASYDNTGSMGVVKKTGHYAIETKESAVIFGDYDNTLFPSSWEHRYYVRNLTSDSMVWVATDDETIVQVYVRDELPAELK